MQIVTKDYLGSLGLALYFLCRSYFFMEQFILRADTRWNVGTVELGRSKLFGRPLFESLLRWSIIAGVLSPCNHTGQAACTIHQYMETPHLRHQRGAEGQRV